MEGTVTDQPFAGRAGARHWWGPGDWTCDRNWPRGPRGPRGRRGVTDQVGDRGGSGRDRISWWAIPTRLPRGGRCSTGRGRWPAELRTRPVRTARHPRQQRRGRLADGREPIHRPGRLGSSDRHQRHRGGPPLFRGAPRDARPRVGEDRQHLERHRGQSRSDAQGELVRDVKGCARSAHSWTRRRARWHRGNGQRVPPWRRGYGHAGMDPRTNFCRNCGPRPPRSIRVQQRRWLPAHTRGLGRRLLPRIATTETERSGMSVTPLW